MFRKNPEQQQFEDKIEEIFLYVQGKQVNDLASLECREFLQKMAEVLELVKKYPAIDMNVSVKTNRMAHRETLLTLAATYHPVLIESLLRAGMDPSLTPTLWMSSPLKRLMDYQPRYIYYALPLIEKNDSPYVVDKEGKNIIDLVFEHNAIFATGMFNILEKKKVKIDDLLKACKMKTHELAARWLGTTKINLNSPFSYAVFKWTAYFWKYALFRSICQMDIEEGTRLLEACIDRTNALCRVMSWQRMPGFLGGKACSLKSGVLKKVVDELVKRKPELLEKIESSSLELENFEFNDEVDESQAEGFHNSL